MQSILSRWFLFGLLAGWALSHTTVFGQTGVAGAAAPVQEKKAASASSIDKLREGLDKKITIDFVGQSIVEVLNHFRDKTGLPINIDQTAIMQMGVGIDQPIGQVEIKAKDEKAGVVLRKFLNSYNLSSVIFEDALLITTEDTAVFRQFRQRVSVNVDDAPFNKTMQDLARARGINLVIDRSLDKEKVNGPVSLQVEDTGIETALRLLAEQAGLKAVRMGNVMFITTAAKAKTIREEEQHQFDNPFNPNVPGVIRGGFGGGFGGIAMPTRVAPGGIPQLVPPDLPVPPPQKGQPDVPPVKKGASTPGSTSTSPQQRPAVEAPPVPRRDQ
ncbi:MAG: hypothetical protein EXR98_15845 [Gemmataceae bacterium]|nr:hypothetical protein [Gemmataceae bacterium]